MLVHYAIYGTLELPEGSKFVEGVANQIELPDGKGIITVQPIIEKKSSLDGDDETDLTYTEASSLGVEMDLYDRTLTEYKQYSAEHIAFLVKKNSATWLPNHDCGICGSPVNYKFQGAEVYYDPGCDCPGDASLRVSSYQDIARWLAMQSSDEIRDRLLQGLA